MNGPLAVNRLMFQLADDQLGRLLHLLNMPTRNDVLRLSRQVSTLTAEVRGLSLPADRIEGLVAEIQQRSDQGDGASAAGSVSSLQRRKTGGRDGT